MANHDIHRIYKYRWDWSATPFLRLLIALIIGIGFYEWIDIRSVWVPSILIVLLIIYVILLRRGLGYQNRLAYGVLLQLITMSFGYTVAAYQDEQKDDLHFSNYIHDAGDNYFGLITDVKERKNRYEAVIDIQQIEINGSPVQVKGKLNTYIPYDRIGTILTSGLHVVLSAEIIKHPAPRNPAIFDYGNYLSRKRVYHQTKTLSHFSVISACPRLPFAFARYRVRVLKKLHKYIDDQSNYAIAASIILGYRGDLDYETKTAFAETGSIHILAVSGMHVGIIFLALSFFVKRINNHRKLYKILKIAVYLLGLWGFVLLAGAPPSALRAAWLFTLILFGGLLTGKSNLYHRLCIAAFLMLIWNTNYLFDIGFQLSFSAILGIAAFNPIWSRLYQPRNNVVQYLWDGGGLTLGATLGTMPLSIYYFHYFPVTGIISSLVIVFLAMVILQIGVIFLACFWLSEWFPLFETTLDALGSVLNQVIGILQSLVQFFHNLPFGLVEGISLSLLSVILLYLLIISLRMVLNQSRKKAFVYIAAYSFLGLGIAHLYQEYKVAGSQQLVIYHDYQNNAIELFDGHESLLIANQQTNKRLADFMNRGLRISKQIKTSGFLPSSDSVATSRYAYNEGALKYGDQELLIVNDILDLSGREDIHWDYIMMIDNSEVTVQDLFDNLKFDHLIIGASNWQSKVDEWIKECKSLEIEYVDIKNTKALIIDV